LQEHHLWLYHTHTGEHIDIVYRRGDRYLVEAEAQLDYFLRDHRTGAVEHYDPHVFDILSDLAATVGHPDAEIEIICGYRAPWSNEFLRAALRAWRRTASTFRLTRLTYASRELTP